MMCLYTFLNQPPTPPVLRKFRSCNRPEVGAIREPRSLPKDSEVVRTMIHGVVTKSSLSVSKAYAHSMRSLFTKQWFTEFAAFTS